MRLRRQLLCFSNSDGRKIGKLEFSFPCPPPPPVHIGVSALRRKLVFEEENPKLAQVTLELVSGACCPNIDHTKTLVLAGLARD